METTMLVRIEFAKKKTNLQESESLLYAQLSVQFSAGEISVGNSQAKHFL